MNNRVMVLNDDEDILDIIIYILTEEGYEGICLNNGGDVLDRIRP